MMKKISIFAGLLILLLLAGCGAKGKPENPDDKAVYGNDDIVSHSDLISEESVIEEAIPPDLARDIVLSYAVSHIDYIESNISISDEENVTVNDEICYLFRIAEETDEKSLTLGFYAFGTVSYSLYLLDVVNDEFIFIEQINSTVNSFDEESNGKTANNNSRSLEELVAAVQQSKTLTVQLAQDAGTQVPFPAEDMSYLMSNFTTDNIRPSEYPFLFIPEYEVTSDTGFTFYLMQDATGSEFSITVLSFDGSDGIYTADHAIYQDFVRLLSPSQEVNMAQLHVFSNGPDAASSIDAAVQSYGIYTAALELFTNSGYTLASMMEEDIFRVDDYSIMEMSDIDPRLVSVLIEYSVKTAYEDGSVKWVTENVFVGALWIDKRMSEYRTYVLGVMPFNLDDSISQAEVTQIIYEKSLAKALSE